MSSLALGPDEAARSPPVPEGALCVRQCASRHNSSSEMQGTSDETLAHTWDLPGALFR